MEGVYIYSLGRKAVENLSAALTKYWPKALGALWLHSGAKDLHLAFSLSYGPLPEAKVYDIRGTEIPQGMAFFFYSTPKTFLILIKTNADSPF